MRSFFTGGIGENSAKIREQTVQKLALLNLAIDETKNLAARFGEAGAIQRDGSCPILVIPTNEEWVIAQDAATLTA